MTTEPFPSRSREEPPVSAWQPAAMRSDSTDPLWVQVYHLVAEQIINGTLPARSRLPAERDLCEQLGVSRVTLRRSLQELAAEGLLERAGGRGWFVAGRRYNEVPNQLRSFSAMAKARGYRLQSHVLSLDTRPARIEEADALRVAPGAQVVDLHRLRRLDGVPFALDGSVLPLARFPGLADDELENRSLYERLEDDGVVPTRADYALDADGADADQARHLEIAVGSPVLVARQTTYDQHGAPVELGHLVYPAGRYRFHATLIRPPIAPAGRAEP